MPVKLSLLCLIHSVSEKDSTNYIIREAITIVKKEDNTSMDLKIISFIPKSSSAPRWVTLFEPDNILRVIGKFIFEGERPHGILQQMPVILLKSAKMISVFITGFVVDQVQNDDNIFESIKIITTEFAVIKVKKNSSIMIIGELTPVDSEFKVEIQDLNFLPTSNGNFESLLTTATNDEPINNNSLHNDDDDTLSSTYLLPNTQTPSSTQTLSRGRKRTKR
ncbi:hypothetical protein GLOIN_2v1779967 [Rhizophagus clarus]|uniref:Uncharacterized protein n=1 Tax=Rhizophagus clarus TaxID=94130 RepID=A0A8H3M7R1_9GLOM|nr:hypothetical protein GLOIN_2v1779967 [Rhizophagus clarus]